MQLKLESMQAQQNKHSVFKEIFGKVYCLAYFLKYVLPGVDSHQLKYQENRPQNGVEVRESIVGVFPNVRLTGKVFSTTSVHICKQKENTEMQSYCVQTITQRLTVTVLKLSSLKARKIRRHCRV